MCNRVEFNYVPCEIKLDRDFKFTIKIVLVLNKLMTPLILNKLNEIAFNLLNKGGL